MLLGAKTRLWFIHNSELSISGLKTFVCIVYQSRKIHPCIEKKFPFWGTLVWKSLSFKLLVHLLAQTIPLVWKFRATLTTPCMEKSKFSYPLYGKSVEIEGPWYSTYPYTYI